MEKITINNQIISIKLSDKNDDYFSLTDMARFKNLESPDDVIKNWMRNKNTLDFLGIWEMMHNPDFKPVEFDGFKKEAGYNSFVLSPQKWIKSVNAIGLMNKSGRYGGGTFAHKDIAFEFASWLSPVFKLYLIKEFQRLKNEESINKNLDWNMKRSLTKINYKIHADSIKENIIIPQKIKNLPAVYANEADVLNIALFGITAKGWKLKNKDMEGNMRDCADVIQLICLSNLEVLNGEFIAMGMDQKDRLVRLNEVAIEQMKSLLGNKGVKSLSTEIGK
jgi:KilA-N domain